MRCVITLAPAPYMHKTTGLEGIPVVDLTKLYIGRILAIVNEFDKSQMLNVDRDTRHIHVITPAKNKQCYPLTRIQN